MKAENGAGAKASAEGGGAGSTAADHATDPRLIDSLSSALCAGALPGELKEFGPEDCRAAAAFVAGCANRRQPGSALVRIESTGTRLGERRMRICIVNDDMPFLVDSVAQAIAARGLIIHRLLHPVVCTTATRTAA
jgi:glutamate dehydrogenase